MKSKIIILFAAVMLCGMNLFGKNHIVWDAPLNGYGLQMGPTTGVKITKVEIFPDSTLLHLHVDYPHNNWIKLGSNIYLHTDEGDYKLKGATVIKPDERFWMPANDMVDFTMTFEPLPATVKSFDFIEPGGWMIKNVRSKDFRPEGIADTYWRDDSTGDWMIGFGKNQAIYDCKIWDITDMSEKKDGYSMTLTCGSESLPVKVGKFKNDVRKITIGAGKPVECSFISDKFLPDYPRPDSTLRFKDTGYQEGDSVTIVGWWKDMPESAWQKGDGIKMTFTNLLKDEVEPYSCVMDSMGRFEIKIPLLNTSDAFIDWGRAFIRSVFEPGETYFILCDFATGQKMIMGKDVRFQNEYLAHEPLWNPQLIEDYNKRDLGEAEAMALLAKADSVRQSHLEILDRWIVEHPTLSQRYRDYMRVFYNMSTGRDLMQARFSMYKRHLPEKYLDYVNKELWQSAMKPYTLHAGHLSTFMRDFLDQPKPQNFNMADMIINSIGRDIKLLCSLQKDGKVNLSDSDRVVLKEMAAKIAVYKDSVDAHPTFDDNLMKEMFDAQFSQSFISRYNGIIDSNLSVLNPFLSLSGFREVTAIADSLISDRTLRDIQLAREFYSCMKNSNTALSDDELAYFDSEVALPAARNLIHGKHDGYVALKNRDISAEKSLTAAKDVSEMSDGEQIMREIVAPYKGKIILVDVWGSWCGPCREALSHFEEHKEHLKPYDIVFIYLANGSPKEAWENVIKSYNLLGDNVVHYNLPDEQQRVVEQFLKVSGYPTYRLIDKEGNLLDVNADVRNLEALENVLKQL